MAEKIEEKLQEMTQGLKYPVGIQSFSEIISGGYAYVDKTMFVKMMVGTGKYYFLSRPRRFGKSLFLSTLQAYFEGRRDLFKGLYLDTDDIDWSPKPVVKFSFNAVRVTEKKNLDKYLHVSLASYESKYGIREAEGDFSDRFAIILRKAHADTGQKVAILVDEYDSLLLDTLTPELSALNTYYRQTLKSLFSVLKNEDEHITFVFVTGISRFSHTSLFSGANHLEDISLLNDYSSICGITEQELLEYFNDGINVFAKEKNVGYADSLTQLKENYDGYHFAMKCPDIYNPYSILRALKSRNIDNYWFQSATPTYLINVLKRDDFFIPSLDCIETIASSLSANESYSQNPVSLLFESGYITIKDYEEELGIFTLGLPNLEVSKSFTEALLPIYSGYDKEKADEVCIRMRRYLVKGDAESFMKDLQTFLHGNPYGLTELDKREKYFQSCLFLMLRALGFEPLAELQTCNARMDMMIKTKRFIYIFELKTDGSAQEAIEQIIEKGYHLPFINSGKEIIKIGANYSSSANNIDGWQIEKVDAM